MSPEVRKERHFPLIYHWGDAAGLAWLIPKRCYNLEFFAQSPAYSSPLPRVRTAHTSLRRSAVPNYALRACPECRLEFLDPQPDDSVLAAIYSDHYFLGEHSAEAAERRSKMKSATGALYIDALASLVRPENADLLEIGCGHGEVLLEARRRGFRVSGIEISAHAAAIANRRLGDAGGLGGLDRDASLGHGTASARFWRRT